MALADLITVEEVNKVARSLMSFVSHFGKEEEALQHAAANPDHWLPWGPSRTTCIVACIPAFTDRTGHSTGVPTIRVLDHCTSFISTASLPVSFRHLLLVLYGKLLSVEVNCCSATRFTTCGRQQKAID